MPDTSDPRQDTATCDDERGHCFLAPAAPGTFCVCGAMDVRPGPSYGWVSVPYLPAVPLWYVQAYKHGLTGHG